MKHSNSTKIKEGISKAFSFLNDIEVEELKKLEESSSELKQTLLNTEISYPSRRSEIWSWGRFSESLKANSTTLEAGIIFDVPSYTKGMQSKVDEAQTNQFAGNDYGLAA